VPSAHGMVKLILTNTAGHVVEVQARPGLSVMENIRALEHGVAAICGGMCACATCHVYVARAWTAQLPPRRYEEHVILRDLASFDHERSRLSCQIVVSEALQGLELEVAADSG
jgi:ferredoxin, 2Fe-2S